MYINPLMKIGPCICKMFVFEGSWLRTAAYSWVSEWFNPKKTFLSAVGTNGPRAPEMDWESLGARQVMVLVFLWIPWYYEKDFLKLAILHTKFAILNEDMQIWEKVISYVSVQNLFSLEPSILFFIFFNSLIYTTPHPCTHP